MKSLPSLFSALVNVTGVAPSVMKYWPLLQPFGVRLPSPLLPTFKAVLPNVTLMRLGLHMCKNRANKELLQSVFFSKLPEQHCARCCHTLIHIGNGKRAVRSFVFFYETKKYIFASLVKWQVLLIEKTYDLTKGVVKL